MYKYIGRSQVAFEYGRIYDVREEHDPILGDCYAIKDESGEWYCYSKSFVEQNFTEE